ncbi:hypothetical protein JKF63_03495 [Porcisia hertigi]|uniref:Uncharacterized protein n=1 Tax=Porcisia hertigi TaxID=2761500 RepID=A0A836IGY1_9TRYP|nr:hypothetical protein JKF63_03495 [Porcisia hertigi]
MFSPESTDLDTPHLVISAYHNQADFAAFLITEYFIKPSKQIEDVREDDTHGLLPLVSLDALLPNCDIEKVAGRICDETHLINERHVQRRKPYHILEKPLIIPAILAALLHRILFEKAGIIISSTTFDLWASKALGFPARTSRLWMNACAHVEEALKTSSVKELLSKHNAYESGVHAIKRQASSKGLLFPLWSNACSTLCASLGVPLLSTETYRMHFDQAIECAISFRKEIASKTSSSLREKGASGFNLHAAGEPELCSCVVFHSFFRKLEILFCGVINSKVKINVSAQVSCAVFVGCLNAFTYYRYSASKAETVYKLLDTVAQVTDGRCLAYRFDLKSVGVPDLPGYLQRAAVLSSDEVFSGILQRGVRKVPRISSACTLPRFADMNCSAINMAETYSFCSLTAARPQSNELCGCSESVWLDGHPDSEEEEEEQSFLETTTIILDAVGDEKCSQYLLSPEEAAAKRQVHEKLYGGKRERRS